MQKVLSYKVFCQKWRAGNLSGSLFCAIGNVILLHQKRSAKGADAWFSGKGKKMKFVDIDKILETPYLYYAHQKITEENEQKFETLEEHTVLCQQYFKRIYENKNIGRNLTLFFEKVMDECGMEAQRLAEEMWCNVVTFHDIGKHNPNFQRDVMGRKEVERKEAYSVVGSEHSIVSAIVYMDYYYPMIEKMAQKEKGYLYTLLMANAYVISKHHSWLGAMEEFWRSIQNGKIRRTVKKLANEMNHVCVKEFEINENIMQKILKVTVGVCEGLGKEKAIWLYFYEKLIYSMLVAADYYATSSFQSGVHIQNLGELDNISEIYKVYETTKVNKDIRQYEKEHYPMDLEQLKKETQINVLRNEIFLDAEQQLLKEKEKNIFYLEAPTGSGKSNISMNLSFQLVKKDRHLKKIYYIYPFNTLVEQNQESLREVFGQHSEIMEKIAVVNSITPIKCVKKEREEEGRKEKEGYYEKALLNRQFLNYPIVLSTHVSLFDTIFGDSKESAFGFHQLAGSIIVLDEFQSYKNAIWGEIISFLSELAQFMHIKIIIMSATLPDLEILKEKSNYTSYLIKNRKKYFCHPCFQKRVEISKELLTEKITMDMLYQHVKKNLGKGKKILVEFITKAHAEEFYNKLKADEGIEETVLCMSGDDSIFERKKTIEKIKEKKRPIILVATQVIEAGVDIDMDIGYKNIAKMDSEEQFIGRVNRSYTQGRKGMVYFFEMDLPKRIYKDDMRSEWEFSIKQSDIWNMLVEKDFGQYYRKLLENWKESNSRVVDKEFFEGQVGVLNFPEINRHMKLIQDQQWSVSVYLGRKILNEKGEVLDGNQLWEEYKKLLTDMKMGYAQKRVELSVVKAKMNCFIYEIKQNADIIYDDQIGEMFYIEDGEKYFENGRLNRKKIEGQLGEFVDFI